MLFAAFCAVCCAPALTRLAGLCAAQETAARLVEEFVRLATSPREHDRSVAAFFLNEITEVVQARRKVQSEVRAVLSDSQARALRAAMPWRAYVAPVLCPFWSADLLCECLWQN